MQVAAARAAPRALGPVRPPASAGDSAYHNLISPIQLHGTAHPSGPPPGAAVAGGGDGEVVAGSAGPPRPTALRARQLPIYMDAASCAARGCRSGFSTDGLQPTTYNLQPHRTAPLTFDAVCTLPLPLPARVQPHTNDSGDIAHHPDHMPTPKKAPRHKLHASGKRRALPKAPIGEPKVNELTPKKRV